MTCKACINLCMITAMQIKQIKGRKLFFKTCNGSLKFKCIFFLLKHKQILSDLSFRIVHESQQIWKLYIFKYCVFESVHSVSNHKRFKSGIYCPITLISVFRLQRYLKSLWDENIANQSQNKLCWLLTKGNAMYRNFSWSAGSVIKFFKNHDLQ